MQLFSTAIVFMRKCQAQRHLHQQHSGKMPKLNCRSAPHHDRVGIVIQISKSAARMRAIMSSNDAGNMYGHILSGNGDFKSDIPMSPRNQATIPAKPSGPTHAHIQNRAPRLPICTSTSPPLASFLIPTMYHAVPTPAPSSFGNQRGVTSIGSERGNVRLLSGPEPFELHGIES
jgi:hypothetical protein